MGFGRSNARKHCSTAPTTFKHKITANMCCSSPEILPSDQRCKKTCLVGGQRISKGSKQDPVWDSYACHISLKPRPRKSVPLLRCRELRHDICSATRRTSYRDPRCPIDDRSALAQQSMTRPPEGKKNSCIRRLAPRRTPSNRPFSARKGSLLHLEPNLMYTETRILSFTESLNSFPLGREH